MKFLQSVANQMLSVKDLLIEELSKVEKPRSPIPVHASDLTRQSPTFCPRQVVLMKVLGLKDSPQVVAHAMRVTWDEGRDKQARINNVYLRDKMLGYWHCVKCGSDSPWGKVPHGDVGPCVKEKAHHKWEYRETLMRHRAGFIGSFDGVIEFAPSKRRILEVKIIKSENVKKSATPDFRSLVAPLAEHRIRTKLYLKLAAEGSPKLNIDTTAAHVLYICRGHGQSDGKGQITPFKEFVVERDDSEVEIYLRMATAVVKSLEKNQYPEGVCTSALSERAEACSVCKQCFSGKYPASVSWK